MIRNIAQSSSLLLITKTRNTNWSFATEFVWDVPTRLLTFRSTSDLSRQLTWKVAQWSQYVKTIFFSETLKSNKNCEHSPAFLYLAIICITFVLNKWKSHCTSMFFSVTTHKWEVHPNHLLLDSAPKIGPLIFRWELDKFKNCWNKSFITSRIMTLLYQQFLNLLVFQWDMSGPRLGELSNNRWSGGICFTNRFRIWTIIWVKKERESTGCGHERYY